MPNALTGNYDAVVAVRTRMVNALIAAMHQNWDAGNDMPRLPHCVAIKVGPRLEAHVVASEVTDLAISLNVSVSTASAKQLSSKAPPGVAAAFQKMVGDFHKIQPVPSSTVRGLAKIQASVPTIEIPEGSTSEVHVRVQIRAHYTPDPGTTPLPEPIHGEVRAVYFVQITSGESGEKILQVTPTANDNQIQFIAASGTGLTSADQELIASQIRYGLRNSFEPMSVLLDQNIPFAGFRSFGSGATQSVVLPFTLSGSQAPPSVPPGNLYHDAGEHFTVAISREYIAPTIEPALVALEAIAFSYQVEALGINFADYEVSVSDASLTWKPGKFELKVTGTAITESILPNYNFTIKQEFKAVLDTVAQKIRLELLGGLSISGLPSEAVNTVKDAVEPLRNNALAQAESLINGSLQQVLAIRTALRKFDPWANTTFTWLDTGPDGVILRGALVPYSRPAGLPEFNDTGDEQSLTAFRSWIPAGTIDEFIWSWRTKVLASPWGFGVEMLSEKHRFLFPKPSDMPAEAQVCLMVTGTQVGSLGFIAPSSGGEVCSAHWPEWILAIPRIVERLVAPLWEVNPSPETVLEDAILGHVETTTDPAGKAGSLANSIIHFAGNPGPLALDKLGLAIQRSGRRDAAIAVFLVLPLGAFKEKRAAFERKFGEIGREFSGRVTVTEDYQGAWSTVFGVERAPATYLMNAKGEFSWHHIGALDVDTTARALAEHLVAGPPPKSRQLRLSVRPGNRAPDLLIPYTEDSTVALRRLRGREIQLVFWKSWSTPCLKELRRLQRIHESSGAGGAVILAINDGEDKERLEQIRRDYGLSYRLVPDPERKIAKQYGVHCWPTIVFINPLGCVSRVQFGRTAKESATDARIQSGG